MILASQVSCTGQHAQNQASQDSYWTSKGVLSFLCLWALRYLPLLLYVFIYPQVDTLEIALREQLGMVDAIFLVESVLTHKGVSNSIYLYSLSISPLSER